MALYCGLVLFDLENVMKFEEVCVMTVVALMFSIAAVDLLDVFTSTQDALLFGFPLGFIIGGFLWGKIIKKDKRTAMMIPKNIPESGFYYHYKHDSHGEVNDYAYEIMRVGCHTEDGCRPVDAYMVAYLPLYESAKVYQAGKFFDLRPLETFMKTVVKDGVVIPRFSQITDPVIKDQLRCIKERMYS